MVSTCPYIQIIILKQTIVHERQFGVLTNPNPLLRDAKTHLAVSRKFPIFACGMANQCTDMDDALRLINQRLRKLEKSDSEKTEEIGRLNRIIGQKDKEIHKIGRAHV